jgi:hypothetical protein
MEIKCLENPIKKVPYNTISMVIYFVMIYYSLYLFIYDIIYYQSYFCNLQSANVTIDRKFLLMIFLL